jgi:hypothetical protein
VRITIATDDHWWWARLAVELSEGRKAAIMPITINPHPVDETSDIPSIPELQADLHSAVMGYDMLACRHLSPSTGKDLELHPVAEIERRCIYHEKPRRLGQD